MTGLPVVALDNVRDVVHGIHGVQTGPGEEGEPLPVVQVAVDGAGTAAEVVLVVDKVHLHAVIAANKPQDSGVLPPPAQVDIALGHFFHRVGGVILDFAVVGQEQGDLVALQPGQGGRQSLHHIAQSAGLGVGRALRGADGNSHTVSPRFTMMGFLAVPKSRAPGVTVTSLSRITFFS